MKNRRILSIEVKTFPPTYQKIGNMDPDNDIIGRGTQQMHNRQLEKKSNIDMWCLMNRYLQYIIAYLIVLGCVKCKKIFLKEYICDWGSSILLPCIHVIKSLTLLQKIFCAIATLLTLYYPHMKFPSKIWAFTDLPAHTTLTKKIYNRIITKDSQRTPIFSTFLSAPQITLTLWRWFGPDHVQVNCSSK